MVTDYQWKAETLEGALSSTPSSRVLWLPGEQFGDEVLWLQVYGTLKQSSTSLRWHVLPSTYLHSALHAAGAIAPVSSCERLVAFDD